MNTTDKLIELMEKLIESKEEHNKCMKELSTRMTEIMKLQEENNNLQKKLLDMAKPIDDLEVYLWRLNGIMFYRTKSGDCWVANKDQTLGEWAGKINNKTGVLDITALEPEIVA